MGNYDEQVEINKRDIRAMKFLAKSFPSKYRMRFAQVGSLKGYFLDEYKGMWWPCAAVTLTAPKGGPERG